MNYSSRLLENAVNELARLPGIGRRTALRLALYLLKQPVEGVEIFTQALLKMRNEIKRCKECHNISDNDICEICSNPKRDSSVVCVVQDTSDVMAIENTGQYQGIYLVLGGIISPMEGIGPEDLNIKSLIDRIDSGGVKEVIFALPATVEGDTTGYYLYKKIHRQDLMISVISRGVAVGDDIEYTDEITLGRSIQNRTPYISGQEDEIKES
jgi:recombination protein RecR